jgi:hypothetical protein
MSTSGATKAMADDFKTPERTASPKLRGGRKSKKMSLQDKETEKKMQEVAKPNTVTPHDAGNRELKGEKESPLQVSFPKVESPDAVDQDKHVRFNNNAGEEENESNSEGSKRGLVSRRGGRCGSPARNSVATTNESGESTNEQTILEFKTYRSPPRKKKEDNAETPEVKAEQDDSEDKKAATKAAPLHASQDSKPETPKKNSVTFSPVPPKKENADKVSFRS